MKDDLISRQAAIAEFNCCELTPDGGIDANDAIDILERLPSAQPEQRWIPVSERLPETEEFVLASLTGKYHNTTFEHAREIADYADGEWCVYAYPHMSAEKCEELIEAWMPLPEPYREERTEE